MVNYFPTTMPNPQRNADGSITLPDGSTLPFEASCPPDTEPTQAGACVSAPGARNINWECGGALVPIDAPGCTFGQTRPVPLTQFSVEPPPVLEAWKSCACDGPQFTQQGPDLAGAAASSGSGGSIVCFALAAAGFYLVLKGRKG